MIEQIHEHSVCTSLLPDGANILDLGCRGWLFHDHFRTLGYDVTAIDIDPDCPIDSKYIGPGSVILYTLAFSDYDGWVGVKKNSDAQATSIDRNGTGVMSYTMKTWLKENKLDMYDLIKMDIEGSEYQVIMSLEKAPATQLSIEFHLHTGVYGQYEMTLMEDKLKALGYKPIKHELTSEHGAGFNFWDSLFVLM